MSYWIATTLEGRISGIGKTAIEAAQDAVELSGKNLFVTIEATEDLYHRALISDAETIQWRVDNGIASLELNREYWTQ